MWRLLYDVSGRLSGATNGTQSVLVDGHGWDGFLEWNSIAKLDLSDKQPEAPPRDTDREALAAILQKADADITAAEARMLTIRVARRLLAKGL